MLAGTLAPSRPSFEELGTCSTEDQERRLGRALHMLDQLQERILGPVDVIDEDDQRSLGGEPLQQLPRPQ